MDLPISAPIEPMLATLTRELPIGDLLYEPKWDGFRCVVFRDHDDLLLQSRSGRPLDRYFPELLDPLRALLPPRVVVDGELVVPAGHGLDFDGLSARIHPAASRVEALAAASPARFVAFDLLAVGEESLLDHPMSARRERLVDTLGAAPAPVHVTPATHDDGVAADWFARFEGAGLDGVIAKPLDAPYAPGRRTLIKVKHERTAEVVVAGLRWHKHGDGVGSLLLGLWDDTPRLVHVGVASSFSSSARRALADELTDHLLDEPSTHPWGDPASTPRGLGRWNADRDTSWVPLAPTLVAEVSYSQLTGDRFRHGARFVRWRPDRDPASCRFESLAAPPPAELADLLAAAG